MNKGICYIICAGENFGMDFTVCEHDFVIAVDGGYIYSELAKIRVDMWIGDLDSLEKMPQLENMILLNKEKDETDTFKAVKEGIKKGYKVFKIFCGTGGRVSHTAANIQCLVFLAKQNLRGYLIGKNEIMTVICDGELTLNNQGYVSVFSMSEIAEGVTLDGFKYPLNNYTMLQDNPIGISNEIISESAKIMVKKGCLLIVFNEKIL